MAELDRRNQTGPWWRDPSVLIPAAGIAVGAAWVLGRGGLWLFYSHFGLTPEEAGWDPATFVVRSGMAIGFWILVAFVSLALLATTNGSDLGAMFGNRLAADEDSQPGRVVLAVVVFVLLLLPIQSVHQAEQARLNTTVGWTTSGWTAALALPGLTTQCVAVEGGGSPASILSERFGAEHGFIRIGATENTVVLFDPDSAERLLVPSSDIVQLVLGESDCRLTPDAPRPSWTFRIMSVLVAYGIGAAVWTVLRVRRKPADGR